MTLLHSASDIFTLIFVDIYFTLKICSSFFDTISLGAAVWDLTDISVFAVGPSTQNFYSAGWATAETCVV